MAQIQTPYGPMYALMTSCEKQAKDEAAGDASLLSQNNKLLSLEGAHYNHVHGWVKSTGNVKKVRKKSLKNNCLLKHLLCGVSNPISMSC